MSNPGVLKLVQLTETVEGFPYRFDIEDNIGEAIHIHYRDIRLDLTVQEFSALAAQLEKIYEAIVDVDGFSCSKFDKVNLVGLSALLPYMEEMKEEYIPLGKLYMIGEDDWGREVVVPLKDSRVVKALNGEAAENDRRGQVNYFRAGEITIQSNAERLSYNLEQVKKYGYPVNDERIILFNRSNVIRDGGHRAGVLYFLYGGDYEVSVRRLLFKDGRFSEIHPSVGNPILDLTDEPEFTIKGNEIEIDLHALLEKEKKIVAELYREMEG